MVSVKVASIAGAVAIFAATAHAADMPGGYPPLYPPPIEEFAPASGWYLRGDIGMSNQRFNPHSPDDALISATLTPI
ncbi:MAG: hypothetical protein WCG92_22155, partial [Hyphomicrobiales bacterium]